MVNLRRKNRISILNHFDDNFYKVAVVFPTLSFKEYNARNINRDALEKKHISHEKFKKLLSRYQPVSLHRGERFDEIIVI